MAVARYRSPIEPLNAEAYYAADYLARRYHVHVVTIWRWAANGTIPAPVKLGPNTSRWFGAILEAFELGRVRRNGT
jgi:predicted DNA-binding transcriptional regulator AlpA